VVDTRQIVLDERSAREHSWLGTGVAIAALALRPCREVCGHANTRKVGQSVSSYHVSLILEPLFLRLGVAVTANTLTLTCDRAAL